MSQTGRQGAERPLRVAVLCDSDTLQHWQGEALRRLAAVEGVEMALAVLRADPIAIVRKPAWRRIGKHTLYNIFSRQVAKRCPALREESLSELLPAVRTIRSGTVRLPRGRTALLPETLSICAEAGIDAVVRFGFGILSGDILTQPRFGVWSFHHGDPEHFRGMPPGIWEMIEGAKTTGAIVQRLSETLDGGEVLAKARVPTRSGSYSRQLSDLLMGSAPLLAHVAAQHRHAGNVKPLPIAKLGRIYRKPTTGPMLKLLASMPLARIRGLLGAMFMQQDWRVVATKGDIAEILEAGEVHFEEGKNLLVLPTAPDSFAADPFVVPDGDRGFRVLVEQFDWVALKGHIAMTTLDKDGRFSPLEPLIETPGHLSYPFAQFDETGMSVYPEAVQDGVLQRFTVDPKSGMARQDASLGRAVLDPTLIRDADLWWMFYCGDSANTTLHLRFAPHPDGPWQEHPGNPVKIDVGNARPAGAMFRIGDMLIRPAQVCVPHYGRALALNRVDVLNRHCFVETEIARLLPPRKGAYTHGLHTLAFAGDRLVVDQARTVFKWRALGDVLKSKLASYL